MQQAGLNDECIALEREGRESERGRGGFSSLFLIMGFFTCVDYGRICLFVYLCGGVDVFLLLVKIGNIFF